MQTSSHDHSDTHLGMRVDSYSKVTWCILWLDELFPFRFQATNIIIFLHPSFILNYLSSWRLYTYTYVPNVDAHTIIQPTLRNIAQYLSPLFLSTFCPSSVLFTITFIHGSSSSFISSNILWFRKCYKCHSCNSSTSVMQYSLAFGFSRYAYSDRYPVFMILRL